MDSHTVSNDHTVRLVERMYWQHGYSIEDIVQRLRLTPKLVEAIIGPDYVDTDHWNEDTGTYNQVRTKRTRAKERNNYDISTITPKNSL